MKSEKLSKYYLEEAFKYIEMVTNPYEKAKLCLHASEVLMTMENIKSVIFENEIKSIETESSKVFEPVEGDFDAIDDEGVTMTIEKPCEPQSAPKASDKKEKVMGIDPDSKEEIDITDAYNLIIAKITHEEKVTLAEKIVSYECFETYRQLTNVTDGNLKVSLADIIVQFGYEIINKVLYDFNDGVIELDIYDFINDNNIAAFNEYVDTNWDDIDKKYPQ